MTDETMSIPKREKRERLNQKLRTRAALLQAAREQVAAGKTPTVAEVADAARVSRATAYRYFPSQESLLVEVPLDIAAPTVEALFGRNAPSGPEDRAALVQNALYDLSRDHETEFRLFLRASLLRTLEERDASDPFRGARRTALLDEALAPLAGELPANEVERLKTVISMLVGVEAMIVLRDVLRLDHDEARATAEWAVRQIVRTARCPPRDPSASAARS
jgi:AcrR family transcriptional regulator